MTRINPAPITAISTRPKADADEDCTYLASQHITALAAPMLTIHQRQVNFGTSPPYDALVITSRHATHALNTPANAHIRKLPCYAVGEATAQAARNIGCAEVISGSGTGKGLLAVLRDTPHKNLCWASGDSTGFDLKSELETISDKTMTRVVVYDALPVPRFTSTILSVVAGESPLVVLVHSGRAGRHWRYLLEKHAAHAIPRSALIVASGEVARQCGGGWRSIHSASLPVRNAMLNLAVQVARGE